MSASSSSPLREISFSFGLELAGSAKKTLNAVLAACASNPAYANLAASKQVAVDAIGNWAPKVNGAEILTPGLRAKLADAFAHLAVNIHLASAGKIPL